MKRVVIVKYGHALGCCPQSGIKRLQTETEVDDGTNAYFPALPPRCATSHMDLVIIETAVTRVKYEGYEELG